MLNQLVCVGRVVNDIEKPSEEKQCIIELSIPRSYKNTEGIYENDIIPVVLWNGIVNNAVEYLHKGDLVGIKGRLQNQDNKIIVVAEKLTFLSAKKEEV